MIAWTMMMMLRIQSRNWTMSISAMKIPIGFA
jgi:hypothetical protein